MPSFLRRLIERSARSVNRSAAGSPVPAGVEPLRHGERTLPTAHERTLIRRRLRALRKGTLEAVNTEPGRLEQALAERITLDELLAGGAIARCPSCGDLVANGEKQCWNCGAEQQQARDTHHRDGEATQQLAAPRTHTAATTAAPTGASSGRSPAPPAR
jgi:hypothetical protein